MVLSRLFMGGYHMILVVTRDDIPGLHLIKSFATVLFS
jgi:hypothetical protein